MKSTALSIMIFLMVNCNSNVDESTPCFRPNGEFFQGIQGRVYKFTPEHHQRAFGFAFYLGNRIDKVRGGGAIPCANLPAEFQVDGLDVIWSGFDKGTMSCVVGDPAFRYVVLTDIEKAF
jgi:hypothetical protein